MGPTVVDRLAESRRRADSLEYALVAVVAVLAGLVVVVLRGRLLPERMFYDGVLIQQTARGEYQLDPSLRMIGYLLSRWNERRKLRRGRCHNCGTVLRDDAEDRFCGDVCRRDWQDSTAY